MTTKHDKLNDRLASEHEHVAYIGEYYRVCFTNSGMDLPIGTKLYDHPPIKEPTQLVGHVTAYDGDDVVVQLDDRASKPAIGTALYKR